MGNSIGALTGAASGTGGAPGSALLGPMSPQTIGGLQAGSSVLAGIGSMMSDQSRATSDRIQAGEWGTQSTDEMVMGEGQVSGLKNQYLSDIGGMTAKLGASGIDVGQGVGAQARTTIAQNASTAEQSTMLASDIRARRDNINVIQANAAASQADQAASLGLIGGILSGGLGLLKAGI